MPPVVRACLVFVALALVVLALGRGPRPPVPAPASAPAPEFSAERAMRVVEQLAAHPRRMGSSGHENSAQDLVRACEALGLSTEVQETTVLQLRYTHLGLPPRLGRVRNVVARLPGARPDGRSVLLMAHYDTRSMTPGASDDGLGVAALLETARALRAGPRAGRDIVLLFTDGEEVGLLGAKAFVDEHRWAHDVGIVLNFDARGNAGPTWLVQTSAGDAPLIEDVARATEAPVGSSLAQLVYRRMPNDTDLSEWLPRGVLALNFANIEGYERYHAPTDTPASLDRATLQHHGTYALALARRFADGPLPARAGDAVFFNAGPWFVRYAERWAAPLGVLVVVGWAGMMALGARRRALTVRGTFFGIGLAAAAPIAAAVIAGIGWAAAPDLWPSLTLLPAVRPIVKGSYFAAAIAVGLGAVATIHAATPRLTLADRLAGTSTVWAGLAMFASLEVPAGSYLVQAPLLATIVAGATLMKRAPAEGRLSPSSLAVSVLGAASVILFWAPIVWLSFVIFGPASSALTAAVTASSASLLAPVTEVLLAPARRLLAALPWAAAALFYATASALPPFDAEFPRPDTLFFAVDEDRRTAFWASPDPAPDAWTSVVLDGTTRDALDPFFAGRSGWRFMTREVPAPAVPKAELSLVGEHEAAGGRDLELRLVTPPGTELVTVFVDPGTEVVSGRVDGDEIPVGEHGGWSFVYSAPTTDGVTLRVRTARRAPVTVHAVTQRGGWPAGVGGPGPRPPGLMAKPGVLPPYGEGAESDRTLVAQSVTFPAPEDPGPAP